MICISCCVAEHKQNITHTHQAQATIAVLEAYVSDNADMSKTSVAGLTSLGDKITTAEYKTDLSQWTSPDVVGGSGWGRGGRGRSGWCAHTIHIMHARTHTHTPPRRT